MSATSPTASAPSDEPTIGNGLTWAQEFYLPLPLRWSGWDGPARLGAGPRPGSIVCGRLKPHKFEQRPLAAVHVEGVLVVDRRVRPAVRRIRPTSGASPLVDVHSWPGRASLCCTRWPRVDYVSSPGQR